MHHPYLVLGQRLRESRLLLLQRSLAGQEGLEQGTILRRLQ